MAGAGGRLLKFLQVGAIAYPAREEDVPAFEGARWQYGLRKRAGCTPFSVFRPDLGKVVSEHDCAVLQFFSENSIVFQSGRDILEYGLVLNVALQLLLFQLPQDAQSGAFVALGKHDVEADDADLVVIEKLVEHGAEFVAPPWPTALCAKAFLVDVDDDNAWMDAVCHRQSQARVIDDVFEAVDERDFVAAGGVADKNQDHHEPERNAHQVLLQAASVSCWVPGARRRPMRALVVGSYSVQGLTPCNSQGFRKNSIFTPASSMMS